MSNAFIGHGATLERSDDGLAWTAIPEVKGVPIPEESQDFVDVTNLDSPGGFREYIKGLKDIGEITVDCNYTRAGFQAQKTDEGSATAIYYRLTLSNGDVFEWQGWPKVRAVPNGVGEVVDMQITIRGTGEPTFTAGA